ncbi:TPA: hypothetical protein L4G09_005641 [Pseudomonas aeruginosa]|nr:hypothetical protein [Pseudomonas aeruginosa]
MAETTIALHWKLTVLVKPMDGQDCLVYNPCDGYRIAEWDETEACFYEQASGRSISDQLAAFWMELPTTQAMCEMEQRFACQAVVVAQITERELPSILQAPA